MRELSLRFIKNISWITIISVMLLQFPSTACAISEQPKPEESPYYSKYKYVKSDSYMNVGVQPLYLPSGMIATVMSRDLILRQRLGQMGITVVFYQFLKGKDVNKFFLSDDLQAGVVGDMPAISAATKKDVIIPAIMHQSFTAIIARRHVFIEELKGKRIGHIPGSTGHYALLKTLSNAGMTEKDVTLVPLEHIKMSDALINNKIFAFSEVEPTASLTLMNNTESAAIHRMLTFGYISFSKEFYLKRPEAVRELLAAEVRAIKWIKSGKENLFLAATWTQAYIKALVGDDYKITPEQIADISSKSMAWQCEVPVIPEKSLKKDGRIASIVEFLKTQGKIDTNANVEKILGSFDRQLIQEVLKMPDKYGLNEFNYHVNDVHNLDEFKAAR